MRLFEQNTRQAVSGGIARDVHGAVLGRNSRVIRSRWRKRLSSAGDEPSSKRTPELHSKPCKSATKTPRWQIKTVIAAIRRNNQKIECIRMSFVRNTANRCADPIAQYPKEETVRVCPGAIPDKVKERMEEDGERATGWAGGTSVLVI